MTYYATGDVGGFISRIKCLLDEAFANGDLERIEALSRIWKILEDIKHKTTFNYKSVFVTHQEAPKTPPPDPSLPRPFIY